MWRRLFLLILKLQLIFFASLSRNFIICSPIEYYSWFYRLLSHLFFMLKNCSLSIFSFSWGSVELILWGQWDVNTQMVAFGGIISRHFQFFLWIMFFFPSPYTMTFLCSCPNLLLLPHMQPLTFKDHVHWFTLTSSLSSIGI